jgi:hypothetical protein
MGHTCTHDHLPAPDKEHPVVAVIAIIAIMAAILLIAWARIEVHGTGDIEAALVEPVEVQIQAKPSAEQEVDAAVTSSRFATGFSP